MGELEMGGVQEVARRLWRLWSAVGAVADHWMLYGGEMHSNLVCAASFELELKQRAPMARSEHPKACARGAAAGRRGDRGHPMAQAPVTLIRRLDDSLRHRQLTFEHRKVAVD